MFILNEDKSIYVTRGDILYFDVAAEDIVTGARHKFQAGDVLRIKVFGKKDTENVVLQKDFPVDDICETVEIFLTEEDTKIGEIINKPTPYWYEVELNPYDNPQTIIGYDDDGPKVFMLYPEGDDIPEYVPDPEEIAVVDDELDMTSTRPVQNQAVARAVANIEESVDRVYGAVAELHVTPQMFGAIGDGEADDTEAFMNCANYAKENNAVLYVPNGSYRISNTLDLRYIDLDIRGTIVISHHGIGLLVGDRSSKGPTRTIKISNVTHAAYEDGDISVRVVGVMNAEVKIGVARFIQLYADGNTEYDAIAYSDFYIGYCNILQITDNELSNKQGWINENTFHDCRVANKFSIEGKSYAHGNNVFYKPCFENAEVILSNCTRNKFYDLRNEGNFHLTMDENTSFNVVVYNFYWSFPFDSDVYLGVTDNGIGNMVVNPVLRELDSVVVYNMNAKTVEKNLYEIGTAKEKISVSNGKVTIAGEWARIIEDAIIPVKNIKFLRAVSDARAFRFSYTPLNANKEVMTNNPLTQAQNNDGADSDGAYNVRADMEESVISINDPNVEYLKVSITTGSSAPSFTFTNLSLLAYYHPREMYPATMLADYFKTSIPS